MISAVAHRISFEDIRNTKNVVTANFGKFGFCADLSPGVYSIKLEGEPLMQPFRRSAIRVPPPTSIEPPYRLDLFPTTHVGIMTTITGSELLRGKPYGIDTLHSYETGVLALIQYSGSKEQNRTYNAYSGRLIVTADFLTVIGNAGKWHNATCDLFVQGDPARVILGDKVITGKTVRVYLKLRKLFIDESPIEVQF
jgi:hypothetical protein